MADDSSLSFILDRIKVGSEKEQQLGLAAALSSFELLWMDHRGHQILKALFQYGSPCVGKELMEAVHKDDVLTLSVHRNGWVRSWMWSDISHGSNQSSYAPVTTSYVLSCRVIQTAITTLDHEDLVKILAKFQGHVLGMINDPSGNYVIQRFIQTTSEQTKSAMNQEKHEVASKLMHQLQFIINDVIAHVQYLSTHTYGCRVVQRTLEFCMEDQKNAVINAILSCKGKLMSDKFGNYVLQQTIVVGDESVR